MDSSTEEVARAGSFMMQERETRSGIVVCEHCYWSFESLEKAQINETKCGHNPDSTVLVDPYQL